MDNFSANLLSGKSAKGCYVLSSLRTVDTSQVALYFGLMGLVLNISFINLVIKGFSPILFLDINDIAE